MESHQAAQSHRSFEASGSLPQAPLSRRHHRPRGRFDNPDPKERTPLEGRLCSRASPQRRPTHDAPLRSCVLETLDLIPRPQRNFSPLVRAGRFRLAHAPRSRCKRCRNAQPCDGALATGQQSSPHAGQLLDPKLRNVEHQIARRYASDTDQCWRTRFAPSDALGCCPSSCLVHRSVGQFPSQGFTASGSSLVLSANSVKSDLPCFIQPSAARKHPREPKIHRGHH